MPQASPDRPAVVRFGAFTLDLRSGELSRDGVRTRLQDQPLALLRCLLEHPGQLVTRDALRRRLWPNGTIVDFEHGVNTALKRLRDALGDEAEHPLYIETVPRRGYRFIAAVHVVSLEAAEPGVADGGNGPGHGALRPGAGLRAPAAPSAYRILEQIGAGGMGVVYRAEDLTLKRKVALKVLPTAVAGDVDRLARFQREAEVLASLNHPHICILHAIGEARPEDLGLEAAPRETPPAARPFLVMELIDGQTLAERLQKGPLPPGLVCDVGAQIADALAAAHRHGVVHRDLKPANIMLTRTSSGRAGVPHVKLLDFGLAKLAGHGEQPALALDSAAGAHRAGVTGQGAVLGTLPYMAPEQIDGKEADARTDIWALGAVLYEMATGKPAFAADSFVSLATQIMTAEPTPVSSHQPRTPPALDRVVRRCLAKSPDDRWASAHDVAEELRWTSGSSEITEPMQKPDMRFGRKLRLALWVIGLMGVFAVGSMATWLLQPTASLTLPVMRAKLDVLPAEQLNEGGVNELFLPTPGGSRTALAWMPDGRTLVFVGRRGGVQQLYVRRLDAGEARPLAGTDGAQAPAVSLDGHWIAFWAGGAIRKVAPTGGPVTDLLAGVQEPMGLAWGPDGTLFFGRPDGGQIWEVPADGAARPVTVVGETEASHVLPCPVPGERCLLYTVRKREFSWHGDEVVAHRLTTGERKVLFRDAADARYLASGYVVFLRRGLLFGVRFDLDRLEVLGTPVPLLENVAQALVAGHTNDVTGAGQFAVSSSGSLAWVPGAVDQYPERTLVSVDRRGRVSALPLARRSFATPVRVSPDGRQLVTLVDSLTQVDLWVHDLERGVSTPMAQGDEIMWFTWWPDGRTLLYSRRRNGGLSLVTQKADGSQPPVDVLLNSAAGVSSVSPDGRQVVLADKGDLMIMSLDSTGEGSISPSQPTPTREAWPTFSPDGRWLAYSSDMTGRFEVYVRPYPGPGPVAQVSLAGGDSPAWQANGRELFFTNRSGTVGRSRMMAAAFEAGVPPRIGTPQPLFDFEGRVLRFRCYPVRCYDVAPDGQRFYVTQTDPPPPRPVVTHINLIQNWLEELKAKVPVK